MITEALYNLKEWSQDGMQKRVYDFFEGGIQHRQLLGQKGAHLCEMYKHKFPVPVGFVITSASCDEFFAGSTVLAPHLLHNLKQAMVRLEKLTGKQFHQLHVDNDTNVVVPLLVSVRASPVVRLPGMTDTILNVGINDRSCAYLAKHFDNPVFALDVHLRFLMLFGTVVLRVSRQLYEKVLQEERAACGAGDHAQLGLKSLTAIVEKFKMLAEVPDDPHEQLHLAIEAVFCSSEKRSASVYKDINDMSDSGPGGTAVVIQEMVFGNLNTRSCTGNAFSRDPETGDRFAIGEFIRQGQGGDVHRGLAPASGRGGNSLVSLEYLRSWGARDEYEVRTGGPLYCELLRIMHRLEILFQDVQQVEFTIQDEKLFVLRSAPASRTPRASVQFASQLASEGVITIRSALQNLDARAMSNICKPKPSSSLPPKSWPLPITSHTVTDTGNHRSGLLGAGLAGVSSGVVCGRAVFSAEAARHCHDINENCIFIQNDASVDDMEAISLANGVISLQGGCSCFLVELSRPMSRTCVVGVGGVYGWSILPTDVTDIQRVYSSSLHCLGVFDSDGNLIIQEGQPIKIDGLSGYVMEARSVYHGLQNPMEMSSPNDRAFDIANRHLLHWADQFKAIRVIGDVTSPEDMLQISRTGSDDGIYLVRVTSLLSDIVENQEHIVPSSKTVRFQLGTENISSSACNFPEPCHDKSGGIDRHAMHELSFAQMEESLTRQFKELYLSSPGKLMCVLLSPCLPSTKSYFTDVEPYLKPLNTLKAQNVKQIPRSCTDYKKVKVHRYDKAISISHDEVKYGKKKDFMQMQVRAVVIAAMNVIKDGKKRLGRLEFLVPLRSGLEFEGPDSEEGGMITLIQDTAQHVNDMFGGMCVPYCIGVMVQTPRACLLMDRLARNCSVSTVMFDCDSLTELMFGSSIRGEGAKKRCYEEGFDWKIVAPGNFYSGSAFDRLDKDGVGALLRQAVRLFRMNKPDGHPHIPLGCCGQMCSSNPASLRFLLEEAADLGLSFLCCPLVNLSMTKVAAAQSRIRTLNRLKETHSATWTDVDTVGKVDDAPFLTELWF